MTSDFLIKIERPFPSKYPKWISRFVAHEFQCAGPYEYDLQKDVKIWLHRGQQGGKIRGDAVLFKHLLFPGRLSLCFNLQDGLAIQQKGVNVFRKLYGRRSVFLWASAGYNNIGELFCPYLMEHNNKVERFWRLINFSFFDQNSPALRFKVKLK